MHHDGNSSFLSIDVSELGTKIEGHAGPDDILVDTSGSSYSTADDSRHDREHREGSQKET